MSTPIQNLKLVLGLKSDDTSQDDLLNYYLQKATTAVLNICKEDTLPLGLQDCVEEIAIIKYRKKDSESLKSVSEGGLSETYQDEIPPTMMKQIEKYKRIRVL